MSRTNRIADGQDGMTSAVTSMVVVSSTAGTTLTDFTNPLGMPADTHVVLVNAPASVILSWK